MRLTCLLVALVFATAADARPARAARPLTWGRLAWNLDLATARKMLERAKMSPTRGEMHRYGPHEPGTPITHTVEPELRFVPRKGWKGEAHYQWSAAAEDYRMDRLSLAASELTPRELAHGLAALEARHGKPSRRQEHQLLWVQAGTWLVAVWSDATAEHPAQLQVQYRLDDRPAPEPEDVTPGASP